MYLHSKPLETYLMKSCSWSPRIFQSVDWAAHESAFTALLYHSRIATTKFFFQLANTYKRTKNIMESPPPALVVQTSIKLGTMSCPAQRSLPLPDEARLQHNCLQCCSPLALPQKLSLLSPMALIYGICTSKEIQSRHMPQQMAP